MPAAITTKALSRRFGTLTAVESLDLTVPRGTVFGFLGPNGAGKTTTLHLLLGILEPSGGHATVAGLDVAEQPDQVRRRCGALLEHHGLYERLSAADNLEFAARIQRLPKPERQARARELLEGIGLWERRNEVVGNWSKGMKQQLAIARARLHRPEVLFLDEPTNGFDPAAAKRLRDAMREMVKDGTTVFLTTHNLPEAEQVCDRVAVIQNGRVIASGPPKELGTDGRVRLHVAAKLPRGALAKVTKLLPKAEVSAAEDGLEILLPRGANVPETVRALFEAGLPIEEVRRVRATLEESFIKIVGGGA